jgi:hypothetical protein
MPRKTDWSARFRAASGGVPTAVFGADLGEEPSPAPWKGGAVSGVDFRDFDPKCVLCHAWLATVKTFEGVPVDLTTVMQGVVMGVKISRAHPDAKFCEPHEHAVANLGGPIPRRAT